MPSHPKPVPAPSFRAKVTSKGHITVPVEIRKSLGLKTGDHLRFEQKDGGIHLAHNTRSSLKKSGVSMRRAVVLKSTGFSPYIKQCIFSSGL